MPPPVARQVTWATTLSSFSPSTSIGLASVRVLVVTVQPGVAVVCTSPIGRFLGNNTFTEVVRAVSDSLGTWNAITDSPPPGTLAGCTSTCACATPVRAKLVAIPAPTSTPRRRVVLRGLRAEVVLENMMELDS